MTLDRQRDSIKVQYQDDRNLNARIGLHERFSTNPYGWSNWVSDHFTFADKARILELGSGPGSLWTANRQRLSSGWRVILTDFSTGMVARARETVAEEEMHCDFAVADAQSVPFPDAYFDSVVANHMLYHVPDRRRALLEIQRVLKPGGYLYATTVGEDHMVEIWDLLLPYIPDIHDRVYEVVRGFTLQNGSDQLAEVFKHVRSDEYPDRLQVTDAEALLAYVKSSPTAVIDALTPTHIEAVRASIDERIAAEGAFGIRKSSGIFVVR